MRSVLVACEFSGRIRDAFRARGFDAWSCDIRASDSQYHIRADVRPLLQDPWDLVIAHPPCENLAASGSWVERDPWYVQRSVDFFWACLGANSPHVAVENPVIRWRRHGLPPPSWSIQPWEFGHPVTKRTCFWVKNPPLAETNVVKPRGGQSYGGKERARRRSMTYEGIARAIAEQWGDYLNLSFGAS